MSGNTLRAQIGVALFLLLVGGVAARYVRVEGPHALVLLAAISVWLVVFTLATIGLGAPLWRWVSGEPIGSLESWLVSALSGAAGLAAIAGALGAVGALHSWVLLAVSAIRYILTIVPSWFSANLHRASS